MFDFYSTELAILRAEAFRLETARSYQMAQTPGHPLRMPLGSRVKEALGNMLIDMGIRLKGQAYSQPETAPSPTFLITL